MIISRTPFRISLLGGGTDYPAWYREHGGAVLATTIDKYCYITCRYLPPFFEHRYRVVYSRIEIGESWKDIKHPAVREVLRFINIDRGLEIHYDGDLPARSGMGTSSSFTVGLLNALYALQGRVVSKHDLAMEGIHVEQELLRETVGSQDQVMAAFGGLNRVEFRQSGDISVRPVTLSSDRAADLSNHLMLIYTGIMRTASDVAESYVADLDKQRRQMRITMDLVEEGVSLLASEKDLELFGELLHEAWMTKRSTGALISNPEVDELYQTARDAGAVGGKLLGAGGGGFLLLFVPPEYQPAVRQRLEGLLEVPFQFETGGSQIIHYQPETDYAVEDRKRAQGQLREFRELDATANQAKWV